MTDFNYTKNIYNEFADFYINKRSDPQQSFFNTYLSNFQLKKHLKEIIKDKNVLDIGCGQGTFTKELHKLGAKIQGIDISEKLIKHAQEHYKEIQFSVSNACKTNFNNKQFDIIVSNLMVHYFQNLAPLFKEISRILKPRGIFIFSVHHPFNEVMKKERNKDEVKIIMNPYFHNNKYYWKMGNMKLISYHHTFSELSTKLKKACFYIEEIEESKAPRSSIKIDKNDYDFSNQYPTLCIIKAIRKQ